MVCNSNSKVAMSGKAMRMFVQTIYTDQEFSVLLSKTLIFARMSPEDKAFLVDQLKHLSKDTYVMMCGDGANDCSALK